MSDAFGRMMQGLGEVESFLSGETAGFTVHVPEAVNVKQIRSRLHMTQARFSDAFGFSLDAISTGRADDGSLKWRPGLT